MKESIFAMSPVMQLGVADLKNHAKIWIEEHCKTPTNSKLSAMPDWWERYLLSKSPDKLVVIKALANANRTH